jgi:hypothetical protein
MILQTCYFKANCLKKRNNRKGQVTVQLNGRRFEACFAVIKMLITCVT